MSRRQQKQAASTPAAVLPPVYRPGPSERVVVFVRNHRHAGVDYREGDTLTCAQSTAELLRQFGAIGES